MNRKLFCLIVLTILIFSATAAFAQPQVNAVSGSLTHGATIRIEGNSFGVKIPASPVLWDPGTEDVTLSTYYTQALPSSSQQGSDYNMKYRPVSFRNIGSPDGRATYFLAGAHATNTNGSYASGNNVGLYKAGVTSFDFFVQYWYRVDPSYDEVCTGVGTGSNCPQAVKLNNPPGENMKEFVLSGSTTDFYGGEWGYYAWCGSNVPDKNFTQPVKLARPPADPINQALPYECSADQYTVYHSNPVNGWVKMQWEGSYNDSADNPVMRLTTYPDGHTTSRSHFGTDITTYEITLGYGFPRKGDLKGVGIGGFSRVPRTDNGKNSFRYFSRVYMDNTHARVMLGNDPKYDACTVMEPQIPSTWSDTSITVQGNLGALNGSGTAYIFVFDAQSNHNINGYPIIFGRSVEPPSPPTALRVEN